jgi:hypothetical protein
LRERGFTKMAGEHEQIAQAIERRRQQEQTEISSQKKPRQGGAESP